MFIKIETKQYIDISVINPKRLIGTEDIKYTRPGVSTENIIKTGITFNIFVITKIRLFF